MTERAHNAKPVRRSLAIAFMTDEWHNASDHARDGAMLSSPLCNCRRVAERAFDLGWRQTVPESEHD